MSGVNLQLSPDMTGTGKTNFSYNLSMTNRQLAKLSRIDDQSI